MPLEFVNLLATDGKQLRIRIPGDPALPVDTGVAAGEFLLQHCKSQQPYKPGRNREETASYCSGTIMRITELLPTWSTPGSIANVVSVG